MAEEKKSVAEAREAALEKPAAKPAAQKPEATSVKAQPAQPGLLSRFFGALKKMFAEEEVQKSHGSSHVCNSSQPTSRECRPPLRIAHCLGLLRLHKPVGSTSAPRKYRTAAYNCRQPAHRSARSQPPRPWRREPSAGRG